MYSRLVSPSPPPLPPRSYRQHIMYLWAVPRLRLITLVITMCLAAWLAAAIAIATASKLGRAPSPGARQGTAGCHDASVAGQQQQRQGIQELSTVLTVRDPTPVPCYSFSEDTAANLSRPYLLQLHTRSQRLSTVSDWTKLTGHPRSVLQNVWFAVPKVIHQVWVGHKPPPEGLLNTWRKGHNTKCPGWTHQLWTTSTIHTLRHLDPRLMAKADGYNGQSDVLRAAILYEHGGVYVDADMQWVNNRCLDDLMPLAGCTGFMAAVEPPHKPFIASSVIAAVKHHPVSKLYMQMQTVLTTGGRGGPAWKTTGPLGVTAAMELADNLSSSKYCIPADNTTQQLSPARHVLSSKYFSEDEPAVDSVLMTVLQSKYLFPASWVDISANTRSKIQNATYVAELARTQYPDAFMYQLGFTTNGFVTP